MKMQASSNNTVLADWMKKLTFWRRPAGPSQGLSPMVIDGAQILTYEKPTIGATFEQYLKEQRFCEAEQQLIERENDLFENLADKHPGDEEVSKLSKDREILKNLVLQSVERSFSLSSEDLTSMTSFISALRAISLDENQDQLWIHRHCCISGWRPCDWRSLHDKIVSSLVKERMNNPSTRLPFQQDDRSSIMADIQNMGRQIKEDLLLVVKVLKKCYPPKMDICNFYASQYHQVFSDQLRKITEFVLVEKDNTYLLRFVNEYYPSIYQNLDLAAAINVASLGKLLSQEFLEPLVKQYLRSHQIELNTFIVRVMEQAKEEYNGGKMPMMEDGCYVSPLAIDIIQLINGSATSAQTITGDQQTAQIFSNQLTGVMLWFQVFQEDVIKQNHPNSKAQIKAHLRCIEQFRDVLVGRRFLLSEHEMEYCLSTLTDMKQSAHVYLLATVHKSLRPQYQKIGTSEWLNSNHFDKMLKAVEVEIHELKGLTSTCQQELLGRLHQEVTEVYVSQLLRGDMRLRGKERQHRVYETVIDDAQRLQQLFSRMGSEDNWLKEILTNMAEVLKLQDVPAIQIQMALLRSTHPDFSEKHVTALLKLKPNLSKADKQNIRETFSDAVKETSNSVEHRQFFSKVEVK